MQLIQIFPQSIYCQQRTQQEKFRLPLSQWASTLVNGTKFWESKLITGCLHLSLIKGLTAKINLKIKFFRNNLSKENLCFYKISYAPVAWVAHSRKLNSRIYEIHQIALANVYKSRI